ncbi:hypothetical protein [Haloechinothrix halophila]|uniref:hypothetical protein n=1 Tax=Haloechinothrix halophila TaxID=1069073 RepID=UPI000416FD46|nr:hypothetical protein [Haloechinothrix halophila]
MTARETDPDLWAALAATEPGIVRTIYLLVTELDRAELDGDLLRGLGTELSQIGGKLIERADRVVLDQR